MMDHHDADTASENPAEYHPGMRIGEIAEKTGISIRTLRHYDDVGILRPSAHTPGGFRLYSQQELRRLLLIRRLKPLGFSLEEMRQYLDAAQILSRAHASQNGRISGSEPSGDSEVAEAYTIVRNFAEQTAARLDKLRRHVGYAEEFLDDLKAWSFTQQP